MKTNNKGNAYSRQGIMVAITGAVLGIALILVTLEIIHRHIIPFVATQQKYIISAEAALLGFLLTEILTRIASYNLRVPERKQFSARFRIMIRIACYVVVLISVVSILASNPTLGISIGALAGVVIAFATQNIIGNVLAAIMIFNTRMVRIGEEIQVAGVKGIVADIRLSHTIVYVDNDVVFIPNTVMVSSAVRRKKRADADEQA